MSCDLRLRWDGRGILLSPSASPAEAETRALRLMRSATVSRIYERVWRPGLLRTVSSLSYEKEDALVDHYVEARPGIKVLELCCGTARAARRWVARGADVLGVDSSMEMLTEARRRCGDDRLVLLWGDVQRRFASASTFDAVICFAALHLLPDLDSAMSAASASLRPGGVLIAWILTSGGLFRRLPASVVEAIGLHLVAPGGLGRKAEAAGLEVLEDLTDGAVELMVARRPA